MGKMTEGEIERLYTIMTKALENDDPGAIFAENSKKIESLEPEQKVDLAIKLIQADKDNRLSHFMESLRHNTEDAQNSFHAILTRGTNAGKTLYGWGDERNNTAADRFLREMAPTDREGVITTADTFREFRAVVNPIMEQQADSIAANLMGTAKNREDRKFILKMIKNIQGFQAVNGFSDAFNQAALTADLLDMLVSENPEHMFSSPEFNTDLFNRFPSLVNRRLSKESTQTDIAEKLFRLNDDTLKSVCTKLENLSSNAVEKTPFRAIKEKVETLRAERSENPQASVDPVAEPSTPPEAVGHEEKESNLSRKGNSKPQWRAKLDRWCNFFHHRKNLSTPHNIPVISPDDKQQVISPNGD